MLIHKNHPANERVKMHSLEPQALYAIGLLRDLAAEYGMLVVVTSISDGVHSGKSHHYTGRAFDWVILQSGRYAAHMSLSGQRKIAFVAEYRQLLGPDFDTIQESTHVHTEFDPKDGPR